MSGKAVRTYVYRKGLIKESRKSWEPVTQRRRRVHRGEGDITNCPMGGRSRATTCSSTARGRGGLARRCLGCARRGCGPPVRRMARDIPRGQWIQVA